LFKAVLGTQAAGGAWSSSGYPLLIRSAIEGSCDILILIKFQKGRPPEEAGAAAD